MKIDNIEAAAILTRALKELPKVRKRLRAKPDKYHDSIGLELCAADMVDGVGQGSNAYFNVPPALGARILDAAEHVICKELKKIGVKIKR